MNFRPELAEAVMGGRKTVTRRAISDNPRSPYHPRRAFRMVGQRVAICPGRGKPAVGSAEVVAITRERFDPVAITADEARAEGFKDASEFRLTWAYLHRDLEPVAVWRIKLANPAPPPPEEGT